MVRNGIILGIYFIAVAFIPAFGQDCITSKCHADFKKLPILHSPVEDGCDSCHEEMGEHKFSPIPDPIRNLCYQCHDSVEEGKHIHPAITDDGCLSCHNPHGGSNKKLLTEETVAALCFTCHDQDNFNGKHIHGPVEAGECLDCHNPHSSDHPSLLKKVQPALCTDCHSDKDFSDGKRHMHSALEDGCTDCHNPHTSAFQYQLKSKPGKICTACHEDVVKHTNNAKSKHTPAVDERACLNCHNPHGAKNDNNLNQDAPKLCFGCHDKPMTGWGGRPYNVFQVIKNGTTIHPPVEDGECLSCHNPHGSDVNDILTAKYPTHFYAPFGDETYELCFQCHDESLVTVEKAKNDETGFRNGTRNLHFLHVDRKKGRTCRACHEVHASTNPKIIRNTIPFGKWDIPIGFKKTETGGSCSPGCHKTKRYDRVTQTINDPGQPAGSAHSPASANSGKAGGKK
ncbi:MAG: cytochrome C [Acidobacteria bacterium]|nr:cytochrome C [Acidobacteriota bacterium]